MSTAPDTVTGATARRPGEPAPDLLTYRIVHRAMTVDLDRLAVTAAELVERPDPARMAALRFYLRAVSGEIESHHHVEDEDVWPFLETVAGSRTALVRLTDDHERLDPLLHQAGELAAGDRATPELAGVLREVADLLTRHVADEERDVFPIITDHVRVEDYERLQKRFRGNLKPGLLPFLVPWAARHATAEERPALLADAGAPMRLLLTLFEPRFRAREELLFGSAGLTGKDRKLVRTMKRVNRLHIGLLRRTRGRIGSRWFGGSGVLLLTVRGRRSGRPHTVPLMCLPDGGDLVVVASQGGVDREPQWWLNLLADPRAEVELHGRRFPVTASEVEGEQRAALWARFVAATSRFEGYQAGVRRRIAVVRLRPDHR
jgi:deazaflavin-dependent oxidoreductase (nitroreductase family)